MGKDIGRMSEISRWNNMFRQHDNGSDPFLAIAAFRSIESNIGIVQVDFMQEINRLCQIKPKRGHVKYQL